MAITITEALAEIKTINKRLAAKRQSVMPYLVRQDGVKDPLEKDGGCEEFIKREMQAINDLSRRIITLRRGIQNANDATQITVGSVSMSISEWLIWRREVAPERRQFYSALRQSLSQARENARRSGANVLAPGAVAEKPQDLIVNISEKDLNAEIEGMEEILGTLDGQLSLKNATIPIEE